MTPAYTREGSLVSWNRGTNGFRLPTEAEWELAARAGTAFVFAGSDRWQEVAWAGWEGGNTTQSVGKKKPNAFGLHDMSGNVWEWVWDEWEHSPTEGVPVDWAGPPARENSHRVTRGGAWGWDPEYAPHAGLGHLAVVLRPDGGDDSLHLLDAQGLPKQRRSRSSLSAPDGGSGKLRTPVLPAPSGYGRGDPYPHQRGSDSAADTM